MKKRKSVKQIKWLVCMLLLVLGISQAGMAGASAASYAVGNAKYTGWKTDAKGRKSYYRNGVMKKGWVNVDNKFYFFSRKTGLMASNMVVAGRQLAADGTWTPVVVLDPGHSAVVAGGYEQLGPGSGEMKEKDNSGTQGVATGVEEYRLNFTIAQKLKTELERRGCKVLMTRYNNTTAISCKERAMVANKAKADAYIRIHANGSDYSSSVNGAMTICTTKYSPYISSMYRKNKLLSQEVLDAYVKATGCQKEYIWETDTMTGSNWSTVPTTLIEMGYMSNPQEDRRMQMTSYQKKMVKGIANGVEHFFTD